MFTPETGNRVTGSEDDVLGIPRIAKNSYTAIRSNRTCTKRNARNERNVIETSETKLLREEDEIEPVGRAKQGREKILRPDKNFPRDLFLARFT